MGSRPWRKRCMARLNESAKYREGGAFLIRHGRTVASGPIETGYTGSGHSRRPVVYVGTMTVPIDQRTLIDGVPAKEWPA